MLNSFFNEVEWGDLDYLVLDLPPGTGDVALDVHTMLPSCKRNHCYDTASDCSLRCCKSWCHGHQDRTRSHWCHREYVIFESKTTGEKEYVFGKGGGKKLAEELRTEVLSQLPLQQPDWNEEDFAPSIYAADHELGRIYEDIAKKVIEKLLIKEG